MQKLAFLAVLGIIVLQMVMLEAKLTVMPKIQSTLVSTCMGDTLSLEVEISQSEGPVAILWWTHGASVMNDQDHYSLGDGGKKLTILDVLPSHSGLYMAHVKDTKTYKVVSFTVDVKDIFMRLLVKNPVAIPLGGTGTLRVSKSDGGILEWVHGGSVVQTTAEPSHYRFVDSTVSTGSVLEISDAQPEQAGIYEVILRSGGCEIRNLIQVNVGQSGDAPLDKIPIIAGSVAALVLVLFASISLFYVYYKKKKEKSEDNETSDTSISCTLVKGNRHFTIQDPIYSTIEETIYDRRNIYEDPYTLGEVQPEDHSDTHAIYTAPEDEHTHDHRHHIYDIYDEDDIYDIHGGKDDVHMI